MYEDTSTIKHTGYNYKLRTSAPMSKGDPGGGEFYIHTFKAEQTQIDTYRYTEYLPASEDFRGQFGDYMSANFNRLNDKGGSSFTGEIKHPPEYVDEYEVISGDEGAF